MKSTNCSNNSRRRLHAQELRFSFAQWKHFARFCSGRSLSTVDITSQNRETLADTISEIVLRTHAGGGNGADGAHVSWIRTVGL